MKSRQGRFLKPEKLQNQSNEGKGKEKDKVSEEKKRKRREKSNGCTLSFYNSYFGDYFGVFGRKKLLDALKGPFGDNVFKNPARYIAF